MERLPHSIKLILSGDLKDIGWDLTMLQNPFRNELEARESCVKPSSRTDGYENDLCTATALLTEKSKITCIQFVMVLITPTSAA